MNSVNFGSSFNLPQNFFSTTHSSNSLDFSTQFDSSDILDQYFNTGNTTQKPTVALNQNGDFTSLIKSLVDYFTDMLNKITAKFGNGNTDTGNIPGYTGGEGQGCNNGPVGNQFHATTPGPAPAPTAVAGGAPTGDDGPGNVDHGEFSTEPQVGMLTEAQTKQRAEQLTQHLMKDFNLTKEQAAGVVGNLMHESAGLNANINQYGFANGGGPGAPSGDRNQGYGWVQWSYDRKEKYLAFCDQQKLNPASPAANYAFLKHELQTSEKGTIDALRNARTAEDAAVVFRKVYERAENPVDSSRIAAANQVHSWIA